VATLKELSDNLKNALQAQFTLERYSSSVYLAMAAEFGHKGLRGFEHWMRLQSIEERYHSMKLYNYLQERDLKADVRAIDAPTTDWASPLKAIEAALIHEELVTSRVHELLKLARNEGDYPTESLMMWFSDEQVQEESALKDLIQRLEMLGTSREGLIFIDKELGQRVMERTSKY
jgi:ferritin